MIVQRIVCFVCCAVVVGIAQAEPAPIAKELAELSPDVLSDELRERFKDQTWRSLRARDDVAIRRDVADWRAIKTLENWERIRAERLSRLRTALGGFPEPHGKPDVRVTKKIKGDGFVVENLIFRTRPDFWVSAYYDTTRNLHRRGVDGFLDWVIAASVAPREYVYAHEFAWNKDRDPVWKRLNTTYGLYDAGDKLDYTVGKGSVSGKPPEATHCNNIGRFHRTYLHPMFKRWFDIDVTQDDEYSQRLETEDLRSMTDEARRELEPRKLFEILTDLGEEKVRAARKRLAQKSPVDRRKQLQADWKQLLGDIQPRKDLRVLSQGNETTAPTALLDIERVLGIDADIGESKTTTENGLTRTCPAANTNFDARILW